MKTLILLITLMSLSAFSQKIIKYDDSIKSLNATGGGNGGEFSEASFVTNQLLLNNVLDELATFLKTRPNTAIADNITSVEALEVMLENNFVVSEQAKVSRLQKNIYLPIAEIDELSNNKFGLYQYLVNILIEVASLD